SIATLGTNVDRKRDNHGGLLSDPGGDTHDITSHLVAEELTLEAIFSTHAQFDHIGRLDKPRKTHQVDVYMHEAEADWLEDPDLNRSVLFLGADGGIKTTKTDKLLAEGKHQIGDFNFEVLHTPGHSPGSISFVFNDHAFIVSGDVLFHHGIGRTDLPGGSLEVLANSIMNKLYTLPDDYTVYPGHGTSTKIGLEKTTNPYTNQF